MVTPGHHKFVRETENYSLTDVQPNTACFSGGGARGVRGRGQGVQGAGLRGQGAGLRIKEAVQRGRKTDFGGLCLAQADEANQVLSLPEASLPPRKPGNIEFGPSWVCLIQI